ncbi:MAG: penicillin-binding protein 1B [Methylococcaceae bacterium]
MADRPRQRVSPRYDRPNPNRKKRQRSFWGWFSGSIFLIALGIGGFFLFSYLGYLDYNVRKQFEGKRWAIPARVYASPVELYAGYSMNAAQFEALLNTLHYRQDNNLLAEGTYVRKAQQITVKTRPFSFWDSPQNSSLIRLNFTESNVVNITDLGNQNAEIALLRMDPVQIGSLYPRLKEDRVLIKLQEAPPALINALLASEDRDFYHHFGISFRGIARAMLANYRAGAMVQGGSTITQQLVKNFYLSSERSLTRKVNEAFMALILEYRYSKDEILEAYLNEIYLGQNGNSSVHGFGLASEFYFDSTLKDLPLHQLVSLVSLVRGPSYYDPRRVAERALQRRNLILDEMATAKSITVKQATDAKAKPLGVIANVHRSANRYPYFMDLVKRQLSQEYREEDLTSEGLSIFTTLDTRVQDTLEQTVKNQLVQLEKLPKATDNLEAAAVVTRRDSGEIAALTSGREVVSSGFNRALDAVRPIGSLIKPVIYLTALNNPKKYTITTSVSDSEIVVPNKGSEPWIPKNYDHREHGNVSLHQALAHSYNLATVRVGMDVGVDNVIETLRNMGVTREVESFPSFLLGSAQLTPLDVTQMYQTLAGDGFLSRLKAIRAVVSAKGERLQSYPFIVKQAIDPGVTYIVNTMLQEVMTEGTGHKAYDVFPKSYGLVGKTGTTNDAKDSWFAGYSGDYLSVVWVGRDDNKPMGLTGATGALPVWLAIMKQISTQPVNLIAPDNIKMASHSNCSNSRRYPYIAGSEPRATSCDEGGSNGYFTPETGNDSAAPLDSPVSDELPENF